MTRTLRARSARALAFFLCASASVFAQTTLTEVEPNDTKGAATTVGPFVLAAGDNIFGALDTQFSLDVFHVRTAPETVPGIFRYELHLTANSISNPPSMELVGIAQSLVTIPCGPGGEAVVQAASGFVAWYGTGGSTDVFVRVLGAGGFATYDLTLAKQSVEAEPLGAFPGGVSLALTGGTDIGGGPLDLWVFDPAFLPMASGGVKFAPPPALIAPFIVSPSNGRGYVAVAINDLCLSTCSSTTSGKLLDFPATYASTSQQGQEFELAIGESGGGTRYVTGTFDGESAFAVKWFCFDVGDPTLLTLSVTQPGGPGSPLIVKHIGPPNTPYFMAATLNEGAYPNGWFFGIDISLDELVAQISMGAPFVGTTGPTGEHVEIIPVAPSMAGLPIRVVLRRLDLTAEHPTPLEVVIQ